MSRSTVAQRVQIGLEATPGTVVPANKVLGSLGFDLSPSVDTNTFRPQGMKYPTIVNANKEWAEGDLTGTPTYDEVVYALSSVFGAAAVTQIMDGATPTQAYRWVFSPASQGADDPQTYTFQRGDGTQAEQIAHVLVTDFNLDFSRDESAMGGSAIGQRLDKDATLTAGATPVVPDLVPIQPGEVCIYLADTHAALEVGGASDPAKRQGNVLHANPSIGGRFNPVWYLNCVLDSFGSFVEAPEPDFAVDYLVEADSNGMAFLDQFRAGQTKFLRIEAKGPIVAAVADFPGLTADVHYTLQWDFAVKVNEPGDLSDEDGVYAINPTLTVVHDPTWGHASQVTVINKVAAL